MIYAAYDFNYVIDQVESFIEWVQHKPIESSLGILLLYVLLVIFTFPIFYITVVLGYAYEKAWGNNVNSTLQSYVGDKASIIGFCAAFILITFAVLLGAQLSFMISRHWLGRTIKRRCLKNHRSFLAVNQVIT